MSVSVIIPSYQQGIFLERTLQSVLSQGSEVGEIIVQDGGSTDGSVEILRRYGELHPGLIQWTSGKDGGQTAAINTGLKKATGDIVCYLNSDDVFYPGALRAVREIFGIKPDVDFVYGLADHIDEEDKVLEPYEIESWDYRRLIENCYFCQPATFWRRSVHGKVGYFDESLQFCMDYEFWLRAGQSCKFFHLALPLAGARRHREAKTFRLRHVGHQEINRIMPRYNSGHVPLKWVRALAKTTAEQGIRLTDIPFWSWLKYAARYNASLLRHRSKLAPEERGLLWSKMSPPYRSSRRQVAMMAEPVAAEVEA